MGKLLRIGFVGLKMNLRRILTRCERKSSTLDTDFEANFLYFFLSNLYETLDMLTKVFSCSFGTKGRVSDGLFDRAKSTTEDLSKYV